MTAWEDAQTHEAGFWGNCMNANTFNEILKQEVYARDMLIENDYGDGTGDFNLKGRSVLDIGGGPISMILRCCNAGYRVVADPGRWPASVHRRYSNYRIEYVQAAGEYLNSPDFQFDEVWMYNVLQHVIDPASVVRTALDCVTEGGALRMFEWCHIPKDDCHLHILDPAKLMQWLDRPVVKHIETKLLSEKGCYGVAFCGVFQPA